MSDRMAMISRVQLGRRGFLEKALAPLAAAALPRFSAGAETGGSGWRTFEVTTHVEVLRPSGVTRVWLPAPLLRETPYQKTLSQAVSAGGGAVKNIDSPADSLRLIAAEFPPGLKPVLTATHRVATRNWSVEEKAKGGKPAPDALELRHFLEPTKHLPIDGIVKETADKITRGTVSDIDKARAIYEWVVENTYRKPATRGCGLGDIKTLLESGDLGGKCADLNALYVGLARAAGIPARDVYGIRLAKSQLDLVSLGTKSEDSTKAQHCRAEVHLRDHGWVPVDPADVRKVVLEEPPGNLTLRDELVTKARHRLFGSWEMNWMAYNFAQDVTLPGSTGPTIGFLMYPQAETSDGRLDSLTPEQFRYAITAKEILV